MIMLFNWEQHVSIEMKRDETSLLTHRSLQARRLEQEGELYLSGVLNAFCHQSLPHKQLQRFYIL